jgi:hypothetical protein
MIEAEVTLLSFDQSLALMGGYAGTIWMLIGFAVGGFQSFAYEASLLRLLFTRDKRKRKQHLIEEDDKREVEACILNREPNSFSYMDFLTNKFVATFCCCFSRTQWYKERLSKRKSQEEAFDRLSSEIDILNFIKASRTLKLLTSVMLRKNQRQLVPYFSRYHLDPDNLKLPENPPPKSVGHLMKHFDPKDDAIDKRILYEITNRKEETEIFSDETSSDEDASEA